MKKVLFLAANPKGTSPLRLDQELRDIGEELRRSNQGDKFTLEQRWAVRPRDIQQAMLDVGPQIVHFSGHGKGTKISFPQDNVPNPGVYRSSATLDRAAVSLHSQSSQEEGLVFEDEMHREKLVSGGALATLFALFTDEVECVVLNGCYSAAQAKAIAEHIPYVIGMSDAITDRAALEFAVGFYKGLGAGRTVEFSYKLGCNAIQMEGIPEHLTPVLIKSDKPDTPISKPTFYSEFPSGPVSLDSPFYVERFLNEQRHYKAIQNPGSLLRIMAPDLMGKTSLMLRILNHAEQQGYKRVYLSLRDAGQKVSTDLNSFLYWFCESVSSELALHNQLSDHWDEKTLGSISNCTHCFEKLVLSKLDQPLVLGVDEVDQIFPHPDLATDFFGMLRNWFERGKNYATWKKLRLVLAYSTEDYSQFRINQSPFNVGEPLKLRELSQKDVQNLSKVYGLNWTKEQVDSLMGMVGGHPYLVRLAMYYISGQEMSLEEVLQDAPTEDGIYSDHLRRYWKTLQNNPQLAKIIREVMIADNPVPIERSLSYQLRSLGLIQYAQDNRAVPSCNLYRFYFGR